MSDLISRQAAIDAVNRLSLGETDAVRLSMRIADYLNRMPPAQPERKKGKWIKTARWGRVYYCDQCRNYLDFDGVNAGRGSANFCPNCGARMDGEIEGRKK